MGDRNLDCNFHMGVGVAGPGQLPTSRQGLTEPVRQGPPDYVDLPDGTRINSSTPRKNPNLP